MNRIEAMIEGVKVVTLAMQEALRKGLYSLKYEDGTEVKPEDYVWDESQFPIEVMFEGKKINVNKQEIIDWYNGCNGKEGSSEKS